MSLIDNIKNKAIEKVQQKYNILLKFINKLLENMNKNNIDIITDFKEISREELIIEDNNRIFNDMKEEIMTSFNKYKLKYTQEDTIKTYIITIIKLMCEELELRFTTIYKTKRINKKKITETYYSIEAV